MKLFTFAHKEGGVTAEPRYGDLLFASVQHIADHLQALDAVVGAQVMDRSISEVTLGAMCWLLTENHVQC